MSQRMSFQKDSSRKLFRFVTVAAIAALVAALFVAVVPAGAQEEDGLPTDLPIVYVHGGAGSAAQYRTQQMRFESNDYPNVIAAIDRPTSTSSALNPILDDFIDDILAETGDDQVFMIGHSLGTGLSNNYLNSDPERSDRVAKYISIDGTPANCGSIPTECINITALGLGGQGHTESVTSPESFVLQHEFLTGTTPATTEIEREDAPTISGRVINFPANNGPGAGTLEMYEVDSLTGHRVSEEPIEEWTFTDEDDGGLAQSAGAWGPVTVDPDKHYEFALNRDVSEVTAHYYLQNFTHSSDLIRLLSAPPDAGTVVNTEVGPDHAALVSIRYREWRGGAGALSDSLKISTTGIEGPGDAAFPREQVPVEALTPQTAPSTGIINQNIGLHIFDAGSNGVTDTSYSIPFFAAQPFQQGIDFFMPASETPDGTIHMVSNHRGNTDRPQVLNVPNWASDEHRIVVEWNDYLEVEKTLPILYVHGVFGSAANYQTQALRFASNDYPNIVDGIDRISAAATIYPILDAWFDEKMAETGDSQVYVAAHSQGVSVMNGYLNSSNARAARVAKYIGIDGGSSSTCPGNVPCKGVWGQGNPARALGPYANVQFADQGHAEAVTSPESFVAQHRFFTGNDPATLEIVPEDNPTIAGRVIMFPDNTGPGVATLRIWEIDGATGQRVSDTPHAVFEFDAADGGSGQEAGAWGPVAVDPGKHYELHLRRAAAPIDEHYYKEPFVRSNHLIRFLAEPPLLAPFTERGPNHVAVATLRFKEWWTGHPLTAADSFQIGTTLPDGTEQAPVELITPVIAPASKGAIGIHTFDVGSDGVTDLSTPIAFWFSLPFQSGADVFLPSSPGGAGTVTLRSTPRDGPGHAQMVNIPNWPSSTDRSIVEFDDFVGASANGTISGRVLDAGNQPLAGASVRAYLVTDTWVGQGHAVTASDGTYVMSVPAGQYRVLFQGEAGTGWVQEWFNHSALRSTAPHVLVTPGGGVSGVDSKLSPGGWVTGTVTGPGGDPVEGAAVWVYSDADSWVGTAATTTRADGTYDLGGIPAGTYRVMIRAPEGSGLAHQWYGGLPMPQRWNAPQVDVTWGGLVGGIDAQLTTG